MREKRAALTFRLSRCQSCAPTRERVATSLAHSISKTVSKPPVSALAALALVAGLLTLAMLTAQASSPATPQAATLDVVISEIAWMGTNASANDEWIELYNNTGNSIDLTGWSVSASDGTPLISLAGTIPASGHFLLERTDDTTVPGVAADQIYGGALGNDGEDLLLQDGSTTTSDRVDCSSGWFAGHAEARVPMVRVHLTATGSISTSWTYNPRCGTATNSAGISRTCTLTTTIVGHAFDYAVAFNERVTTAAYTTTEETSIERSLLDLIEGATTSIDVALYGLNRQRVVGAIVDAHNRGVTVRIVGDTAASGAYSTSYQQLVDAGITIVTDSSGDIQHNKFAIVDEQFVWTGSTNLTDTGFTLNANNSLVITDTTMAAVYQADHFAMFFWTDDLLTDRTLERIEQGVQVSGICDPSGASFACKRLREGGADITIEDFPGKLHHKFAVIDVEGSDPTVILGSYNWTEAGAYQNDENTLIVHDRGLARAYYREWKRLALPFPVHLPLVRSQWPETPETAGAIVITDIPDDGMEVPQEPNDYVLAVPIVGTRVAVGIRRRRS